MTQATAALLAAFHNNFARSLIKIKLRSGRWLYP
jgi:hypothetical protein